MYVVTGASGNTGSVVASALLEQKKPVRVVVRDAAKGDAWKARGAEVAVAGFDDEAALAKAFAGAAGVYALVPPLPQSKQVLADNSRRIDALRRAVEASGVPHVVLLSSVGAQHASGTGPIRSLHEAEQKLGNGKAALTSVRAAYFMENWGAALGAIGGGALPTFVKSDLTIPMIATKDIGATAARALVEGGKGRQVIELAGPRDYSPRDVAAALSSIVGKTIVAADAPEEAVVPTFVSFGISEDMASLFREMYHGIHAGTVAWEGGAARAVRGATPIEEVLRALTRR